MISPVNCQVWVHFYLGRLRLEAQRKLQQLHLGGAETLGGEPHDDLVLLRGRHPRPRGQLTEVRHKRPKVVRVLRIKILCRLKLLSLHLTWDSKARTSKTKGVWPHFAVRAAVTGFLFFWADEVAVSTARMTRRLQRSRHQDTAMLCHKYHESEIQQIKHPSGQTVSTLHC